MTNLLNPSFESGIFNNWNIESLGSSISRYVISWWKTDGNNAGMHKLASDIGRNTGDYIYSTQNVYIDNFTKLVVDINFHSIQSNYEFRVYIDSTLLYSLTNDGNIHTDIIIDVNYTGNHSLKFGIYCTTGDSNDAWVAIDNIRLAQYFVKTAGDDAKTGTSWAQAWKTINKAATTVADGSTVHIGFGDYVNEPATNKIAPQNIGASGIYYLPETATTGGGTGTVSIEQNA